MAPATPLGERCIENWARALRSEAVSCMLPVGPETKMEIPGKVWPIYRRGVFPRTMPPLPRCYPDLFRPRGGLPWV